jgi:hypothetical protein
MTYSNGGSEFDRHFGKGHQVALDQGLFFIREVLVNCRNITEVSDETFEMRGRDIQIV